MKKSYLLVYSALLGTRDEVTEWLDSIPEIIDWRYDMPNCYYLISEESASELARRLRAVAGKNGRFLITEISSNKQGWLPKETWYLINNKKRKPGSD